MHVRVSDVEKWVGREQSAVLEPPWPRGLFERLAWPMVGVPTGTVTIRNTGESLLVDVDGEATVTAECSRCLTPFPLTLRFHDTEEYRRGEPGPQDDWQGFSGDEIDLDDLVSDAILLAEPPAPVCDSACRGLCSQCGANLNEGPCGCEPPVDHRWAVLEGFRPRGTDDTQEDM
jgi:uncharacterized protein